MKDQNKTENVLNNNCFKVKSNIAAPKEVFKIFKQGEFKPFEFDGIINFTNGKKYIPHKNLSNIFGKNDPNIFRDKEDFIKKIKFERNCAIIPALFGVMGIFYIPFVINTVINENRDLGSLSLNGIGVSSYMYFQAIKFLGERVIGLRNPDQLYEEYKGYEISQKLNINDIRSQLLQKFYASTNKAKFIKKSLTENINNTTNLDSDSMSLIFDYLGYEQKKNLYSYDREFILDSESKSR